MISARLFLCFCIVFNSIYCGTASADVRQRSKDEFATEFRSIEAEGLALIKLAFPANDAITELIVRYDGCEVNSEYVANFNAIAMYINSILVPELVNPTPAQAGALPKIQSLIAKHDALQIEYSRIYKRLPSFD